ncbi:MAG: sigma 54-interacting transcriptional regulator [Polyangiaceae bacterium]
MVEHDVETEVLSARAKGPVRVPVKLVVVQGPDEGLEIGLERVVKIGADPSCQFALSDSAVSREHCVVSAIAGQIAVKDLGSRNGTFLGTTRITEASVPLGALLQLGNTTIAVQPRLHVREVAPSSSRTFGDLYGEAVAMREVFAILERVAPTDATVLVEGESGTGKELVARAVHQHSSRARGPYVVFDCGAVPPQLAESELFGHKRGAFSGAVEDRMGAFGRADGGTICLDEIGELPLELQPKLLRALETGEIRRIGEDSMRRVDVRVIAATNRDLRAEAQRGTFRADLLYRLDVVKVRMPPLRHRPEDIAGLTRRLLGDKLVGGDTVEGDNLRKLMSYAWPGNVRELRNVLDRAMALAPTRPARFADLAINLGASEPLTIGATFPGVANAIPYKDAKAQLLAAFDRAYVEALMDRHRGNVSRAAEAADLSRRALYDLIKRTTGEDAEESE